jgi:endonuclease YncB( thermonuclease family)
MDRVFGYALRVIDGDTFELNIDSVSRGNEYEYADVEKVRIRGIDAPELNTDRGRAAKVRLQNEIQGQRVEVDVSARDRYGRLIGDIALARR